MVFSYFSTSIYIIPRFQKTSCLLRLRRKEDGDQLPQEHELISLVSDCAEDPDLQENSQLGTKPFAQLTGGPQFAYQNGFFFLNKYYHDCVTVLNFILPGTCIKYLHEGH
jgi:hypothetical protein